MKFIPVAAAATAPAPAVADAHFPPIAAADRLLDHLTHGRALDAAVLRTVMAGAFGGSDAEGAWDWKTAYDACEAATVLFLRKFGRAMQGHAGTPGALLGMLTKLAALFPSQTRRSEESQAFQQFSTPIPYGFVASVAAAITRADLVLEPSTGTGLLAVFAELAGAGLALNELASGRADFRAPGLTGANAPGDFRLDQRRREIWRQCRGGLTAKARYFVLAVGDRGPGIPRSESEEPSSRSTASRIRATPRPAALVRSRRGPLDCPRAPRRHHPPGAQVRRPQRLARVAGAIDTLRCRPQR
jgi:hypothetical protein